MRDCGLLALIEFDLFGQGDILGHKGHFLAAVWHPAGDVHGKYSVKLRLLLLLVIMLQENPTRPVNFLSSRLLLLICEA